MSHTHRQTFLQELKVHMKSNDNNSVEKILRLSVNLECQQDLTFTDGTKL